MSKRKQAKNNVLARACFSLNIRHAKSYLAAMFAALALGLRCVDSSTCVVLHSLNDSWPFSWLHNSAHVHLVHALFFLACLRMFPFAVRVTAVRMMSCGVLPWCSLSVMVAVLEERSYHVVHVVGTIWCRFGWVIDPYPCFDAYTTISVQYHRSKRRICHATDLVFSALSSRNSSSAAGTCCHRT